MFVKHFELELRVGDPTSRVRLETRVLIQGQSGWAGYTYRWNAGETDAVLIVGAETELLTIEETDGSARIQEWRYPSRAQCLECHTAVHGYALGVRTRQLNRDFSYPAVVDNQLRAWNHIDLFATDIGNASQYDAFSDPQDGAVDVVARARILLEVNCAMCHQPAGPTPTGLDLRYDTDPGQMAAIEVAPTAGDLGLMNPAIIQPGAKESSVLWQRMNRLDAFRMPPVGSTEVDDSAVDIIGAWIDEL